MKSVWFLVYVAIVGFIMCMLLACGEVPSFESRAAQSGAEVRIKIPHPLIPCDHRRGIPAGNRCFEDCDCAEMLVCHGAFEIPLCTQTGGRAVPCTRDEECTAGFVCNTHPLFRGINWQGQCWLQGGRGDLCDEHADCDLYHFCRGHHEGRGVCLRRAEENDVCTDAPCVQSLECRNINGAYLPVCTKKVP